MFAFAAVFVFVFAAVFVFVFAAVFVFVFVAVLCVFCPYLVNDLLAHCDDVGVLLPQHDKPLQTIHFARQPFQE